MATERIDNPSSIWVLVEHSAGEWHEVTLELLGEARRISGLTGKKVVALLLGTEFPANAATLGEYGADEVYCIKHPLLQTYNTETCTSVLFHLVNREKPGLLLMGATSIGRDLAPRLATRLKTGLVSGCVDLKVNREGSLDIIRPVYDGNVYSTWVCPERKPQIVTMLPGVIGRAQPDKNKKAEVIEIAIDINSGSRTKVIGFIPADPKTLDIAEANVLVAFGRGLGTGEKTNIIKELADMMEASVAGSRQAVDSGWIPAERQIGMTGKTVSAKLLITLGISGAIQFIAGIKDCQFIIAVNTDRSAPIFKVADIGINCDMHQLIPCLISQLKRQA